MKILRKISSHLNPQNAEKCPQLWYRILKICGYCVLPIAFANMAISLPAYRVSRTLYDNFDASGVYSLIDGQTSPNGKWIDKYTGYGSSGTMLISSTGNNKVFYEKPLAAKSASETHSALTLSTSQFQDVDIYLKVKTKQQLRQGSPPNPWEAAWIMWRYQDDWHHYYFIFKPNGIELGKKQNDSQSDSQVFLFTASDPKMKIGEWNIWHIRMIGGHIEISLKIAGNWQTVIDFTDQHPIDGPGKVGLYTEDAYVQFDSVYLTPLNS